MYIDILTFNLPLGEADCKVKIFYPYIPASETNLLKATTFTDLLKASPDKPQQSPAILGGVF